MSRKAPLHDASWTPYKPDTTFSGLFTPIPDTARPKCELLFKILCTRPHNSHAISLSVSVNYARHHRPPGHYPHDPNHRLPEILFLKLYDRRFSQTLRLDAKAEPWSVKTEAFLKAFNRSSNRPLMSALGKDDSLLSEYSASWSAGQREAYLEERAYRYFANEIRAYKMLQQHQGRTIPRVYGTVICHVEGVEVRGLLMEHLRQHTRLEEVPGRLGRLGIKDLQSLGDAAVEMMRSFGRDGVVGKDMFLHNLLVVCEERKEARVWYADFALARIRAEEGGEEWERVVKEFDMEGRVGYGLQNLVLMEERHRLFVYKGEG